MSLKKLSFSIFLLCLISFCTIISATSGDERCLKEEQLLEWRKAEPARKAQRFKRLETSIADYFRILEKRKFSPHPQLKLLKIDKSKFGALVVSVLRNGDEIKCDAVPLKRDLNRGMNFTCYGASIYEKHTVWKVDAAGSAAEENAIEEQSEEEPDALEAKVIDFMTALRDERGLEFCLIKIHKVENLTLDHIRDNRVSTNDYHYIINAELAIPNADNVNCELNIWEPRGYRSGGFVKYLKYAELEMNCGGTIYEVSNANNLEHAIYHPNEKRKIAQRDLEFFKQWAQPYRNYTDDEITTGEFQYDEDADFWTLKTLMHDIVPKDTNKIAYWVWKAFVQWSELKEGKSFKVERILNITQFVYDRVAYLIRTEVSTPDSSERKNCSVVFWRDYFFNLDGGFEFSIKCERDSMFIVWAPISPYSRSIFDLERISRAVLAQIRQDDADANYEFVRIVPNTATQHRANGQRFTYKAKVSKTDLTNTFCDFVVWNQMVTRFLIDVVVRCEGKVFRI